MAETEALLQAQLALPEFNGLLNVTLERGQDLTIKGSSLSSKLKAMFSGSVDDLRPYALVRSRKGHRGRHIWLMAPSTFQFS